MNWEDIELEYKQWVSSAPDKRMFSYRAFIEWLKQNYNLKTEKYEQENVSSITKIKRN